MIYSVSHQIKYRYSAPVFLEPHIVRLHPRNDPCQRVRSFSLTCIPEPVGCHNFLDIEGNHTISLWFEEKTKNLKIVTNVETETFCTNPFDYLITEETFFQLPVSYPQKEVPVLGPYLSRIDEGETVKDFALSVINAAEGRTIDFLRLLCTEIYENYTVEIRHKGPPHPPWETIANKKGACRDLALLYVMACRSVGLAARFVSGYQEGDQDMDTPHLHAWAEVYIPGGGWRGYDPTHGLAVADRHVVLAASHEPSGASPVKGTFRGTGVSAEIEYFIQISALSETV